MGTKNRLPQFRTDSRKEKIKRVLEKRQPDITIILENINDPHNMSAALRSCDATGVLEVCFLYHGSQPFPKLGRQSSASAKKWVDARMFHSVDECFEFARSTGKKIYTTHMSRDAVSLYDLNLSEPVALVFGNEHAGVSERAAELADGNYLIPQVGMIQSLNISVACAVSLYEAFRQRTRAGLFDSPRFSPENFELKMDDWLKR
ncbi:MAG: TrmH family RNA methyltransferase [Candidatus Kapaibacterium sp.]